MERKFLQIRRLWGPIINSVASYGALGHMPPRLPTISFLVRFRVNLTANYPGIRILCIFYRVAGADVNKSQLFRSVLH